MAYEFLQHTADVKFRARGATWEEMFVSAAQAVNEMIRGDIKILQSKKRIFEVTGPDRETLLHDFLEEFLFMLEAEDFLVSEIKEVQFDEKALRLNVKVVGDSAEKYKFTNDVKAVTFNEMYIRQEEDTYVCQVVLDV